MTRIFTAVALTTLVASCGEAQPTPAATEMAVTSPAPPAATATADPAADTATPDGWQRVAIEEQGFSVAIPPSWEPLSADVLTESGALDELLGANPDAESAIEQGIAAIESGQIAFFAFDASPESLDSGFATNVNAIAVGPVTGSAEQAAEEIAGTIAQQLPVTGEVETDTASLPAGEAAVVRYRWVVEDTDGGSTEVEVTQYAIIADRSGNGFILSMSAAASERDRYEDVFRQIAESFRDQP